MRLTKTRITFVVGLAFAIAAAACGTIADLDVKYDSVETQVDGGKIDPTTTIEAGRIIRDSSFVEPEAAPPVVLDPSDAGPCNPDTDPDGGCDFTQGLGCCLLGTKSSCIFQWEIADLCNGGVFVGCRADDPNTESACCWRNGPAGSRMSVLATSCDGGAHACDPLADGGGTCEGSSNKCAATVCNVNGGTYTIGSCGTEETCQ